MSSEPIPHLFDSIGTGARVAVLGAGSWGTALASVLAAHGHSISLWARDKSLVDQILSDHENRQYLPGAPLSSAVHPTHELSEALNGADVVVFAVPSGATRQIAREAAAWLGIDTLLISAGKGLEDTTGLRMSQVMEDTIPGVTPRVVVLSGPNLAVEVGRRAPTASVAASTNIAAARAVQRLFLGDPNPTFRVYTGRDVVGVELGGAIKNCIAIGAGILEGVGFGDNSRAAYMTRGLAEAVRLGAAQGAQMDTFLGLSGVGDLIATGGSKLSRNYRVGYAMGLGRPLAEILSELGQVAEGVPTTKVLCDLADSCGVEIPLCAALHAVLFEGRPIRDMIQQLMIRPPKEESSKV